MTHEEVSRFLRFVKESRRRSSRQYYVLFRLLAESGIRIQAAMGLRLGDVQHGRGESPTITVKWLKKRGGEASQVLVISDQMAHLLRRFAKGRSPTSRIFQVGDRAARYAFERYCQDAGLPKYSPKCLRHYHLMAYYKASGHDLRLVQDRAGHASPATTTIYVAALREDHERALQEMPTLP
jgi:integrase